MALKYVFILLCWVCLSPLLTSEQDFAFLMVLFHDLKWFAEEQLWICFALQCTWKAPSSGDSFICDPLVRNVSHCSFLSSPVAQLSSFIQLPAALSLFFYRITWLCSTTEDVQLTQSCQVWCSWPMQRRAHIAEDVSPHLQVHPPLHCFDCWSNFLIAQWKKCWRVSSSCSQVSFPLGASAVQVKLLSGKIAWGGIKQWLWFVLVNMKIWWDKCGSWISQMFNQSQGIIWRGEMRNQHVLYLIQELCMCPHR